MVINQDEFAKIYAKGDIQLVDVRTPEEYSKGAIEGAILINYMSSDFLKEASSKLDKKKPIYLYCGIGRRSNKAMTKLLEEGFKKVYNLEGGYRAWKKYHKR